MIGYSDINSFNWADAELESMNVTYDNVEVILLDHSGKRFALGCVGFIGIQWLGVWDEMIVEKFELTQTEVGPLCKRNVEHQSDSGSEHRNLREFQTAVLTFIDGTALEVTAAHFTLMPMEPSGED